MDTSAYYWMDLGLRKKIGQFSVAKALTAKEGRGPGGYSLISDP